MADGRGWVSDDGYTPECPGTPWYQQDGEWRCPVPSFHPEGLRFNAAVVRTLGGRERVEAVISYWDAPPLPEVAWAELAA
jgi:hypothetical protein